jgi:hypothetical protein
MRRLSARPRIATTEVVARRPSSEARTRLGDGVPVTHAPEGCRSVVAAVRRRPVGPGILSRACSAGSCFTSSERARLFSLSAELSSYLSRSDAILRLTQRRRPSLPPAVGGRAYLSQQSIQPFSLSGWDETLPHKIPSRLLWAWLPHSHASTPRQRPSHRSMSSHGRRSFGDSFENVRRRKKWGTVALAASRPKVPNCQM